MRTRLRWLNVRPSRTALSQLVSSQKSLGIWSVQATSAETAAVYECQSIELLIQVEEAPFYVTYALYLVGGIAGGIAAGAVVYVKKFRNRG